MASYPSAPLASNPALVVSNPAPVASYPAAPVASNPAPVASNSVPFVSNPAPVASNPADSVVVVAPNSIPVVVVPKLMVFPTVAPKSKLVSAPAPIENSADEVVVVSIAPVAMVGLSGLVE